MVIVTSGKRELCLLLAGSYNRPPAYCAIGSGSGIATAALTTLFAERDRNAINSVDATVSQKVTWQTDFNSIEMSGTDLTEFAVHSSGASESGTMWNIETFQPSISFDGTNELRIECTYEIF